MVYFLFAISKNTFLLFLDIFLGGTKTKTRFARTLLILASQMSGIEWFELDQLLHKLDTQPVRWLLRDSAWTDASLPLELNYFGGTPWPCAVRLGNDVAELTLRTDQLLFRRVLRCAGGDFCAPPAGSRRRPCAASLAVELRAVGGGGRVCGGVAAASSSSTRQPVNILLAIPHDEVPVRACLVLRGSHGPNFDVDRRARRTVKR